jgi:hypothetical protein
VALPARQVAHMCRYGRVTDGTALVCLLLGRGADRLVGIAAILFEEFENTL